MKLVLLIFIVLSIFITSCAPLHQIPNTLINRSSSPANQTPMATSNEPMENKDIPVCPTETATGCRKPDSNKQYANEAPCNENVQFTHLPMKFEDFALLEPMGLMIGGHVTPIDHMYFVPAIWKSERDRYDVIAVANGILVQIGHQTFLEGEKDANGNQIYQYTLIIKHSCSLTSVYNLVTVLSPRIQNIVEQNADKENIGTDIPITAGELLGKIGGRTLDFNIIDTSVTLKGFVNPKSYSDIKIHITDPLPYFEESLRNQLLSKDARQIEPRGGKIDYDIDGKLVGNWFKVGTHGYNEGALKNYWAGHLSIVYDAVDPSQIRVSIGDFNGEPLQFGVAGNTPDPSNVDKSIGLIKYELVKFEHFTDSGRWDWLSYNSNIHSSNIENMPPAGVLLAQLIDNRTLKVEIFPGKRASDISGFDEKAVLYER